MSAPLHDRLDVGPARWRSSRGLVRRVARGVLAGVGAGLLVLVGSAALAPGWRPPPVLAPLDVAPLTGVAPVDRHLPYAFVERSDVLTTAGTRARLVRPRGAEGSIPGLVLVPGAGRTTRDDLAEEAEALARGGLAVLTYDKRAEGYGLLGRDYGVLADDALAALDVVARQPGVDPDRVGLLGVSEGGWVVPLAAARAPLRRPVDGQAPARVAFTVLVSAPVVSPAEQAVWVADRRLPAAPRVVRASVETVLGRGPRVNPSLGTDVVPALRAAGRPTYALWGAADRSVPVAVAAERVRVATGGRDRLEVVPGAGHRLPLASGWAERVSDWVRRGYPDDDVVRGTQPETLVGLPTLPAPGPLDDSRLVLVVAGAAALTTGLWPARRSVAPGLGLRTSRRG